MVLLKEDGMFKCQIRANQKRDKAKEFQGIKINGQSLEFVEKVCYVGNNMGAREAGARGAVVGVDGVISEI